MRQRASKVLISAARDFLNEEGVGPEEVWVPQDALVIRETEDATWVQAWVRVPKVAGVAR